MARTGRLSGFRIGRLRRCVALALTCKDPNRSSSDVRRLHHLEEADEQRMVQDSRRDVLQPLDAPLRGPLMRMMLAAAMGFHVRRRHRFGVQP